VEWWEGQKHKGGSFAAAVNAGLEQIHDGGTEGGLAQVERDHAIK
jgi:hypothetical protein